MHPWTLEDGTACARSGVEVPRRTGRLQEPWRDPGGPSSGTEPYARPCGRNVERGYCDGDDPEDRVRIVLKTHPQTEEEHHDGHLSTCAASPLVSMASPSYSLQACAVR